MAIRKKKGVIITNLYIIIIAYVCVLIITILSRSSSIADINLLNCFKLAAITCSSSVCVDPIHSKLNSFKLFANVLWHRDKSVEARERDNYLFFQRLLIFACDM